MWRVDNGSPSSHKRKKIHKEIQKFSCGIFQNRTPQTSPYLGAERGEPAKRRFYFVYNDKIKEKLVLAALDQDFIKEAPLVVVGCADMTIRRHYMERGAHLYAIQDVSCSIQNMMLLAHSLGLGSVWVGAFDEDEVSAALRLPDNLMPIVITPVGYPDEFPDPPKRVSSVEAITEVK